MAELALQPGMLDLSQLRAVWNEHRRIRLEGDSEAIRAAVDVVRSALEREGSVYGINTGFGRLARKRIPTEDLEQLQQNIVLSHAAGTGPLLEDNVVRLAMIIKITSLAQGYSGVRPDLIDLLTRMANADVLPCIPGKGSVGASGDLAPLAHLACALLGVGTVHRNGETIDAKTALHEIGAEPLVLAPKEGLALLNGTQVSTALGLAGLFQIERVFSAAMVAGAMSVDAALGSDTPFDERIHAVRGHQGQSECARCYRELLAGSKIRESHLDCDRVQDPYSLRCQPQVMGACLDHMRFAAGVLEREANAVSDNPLVFADEEDVLAGGNFHAEPVAMCCDVLALAIAEVGALSERRIALLIDRHFSELPAFLVADNGLNSGFMLPQVTAAALASENKSLAHPACVDSIPTSANQEDHVSMATFAARRLQAMAENAATIVGIELLAASQGIDLRTDETSAPLAEVHSLVRSRVRHYDQDRLFAPDIENARQLVESGELDRFCTSGSWL